MGRSRRQRRQPHGSAWHWKQTDCWYCTQPGSKRRLPLFDEEGQRIRGKGSKEAAELALARVKVANEVDSTVMPAASQDWQVARVCSQYIQYCERGVANGTLSKSHRDNTVAFLNDLCKYCGALKVGQLKKGHIQTWWESHSTWHSPATRRSAIAIVLAAFNHAEQMFGVPSPLKGLKKPMSQPRLESFSAKDEQTLYAATERCFGDFLFAAIHSGLRPFCELAKVTADDVEETDRGMMWRIYSSKTKKIRKIPLQAEVAELSRRLMKTAPRGSGLPLFRNTQGKPWKQMTGVVRFLTLKKKLGWDQDSVKTKYSCYTCRHTFVHRMLSGYWNGGVGCSIETVAELIGDTPKVAFDHYGKEWGQHYQDPLWSAIGAGAKDGGKAVKTPGSPATRRRAASGSAQRRTSARAGEKQRKHQVTKGRSR